MPLFNRDPEVEALAEEVRKLTKAKSKTEADRHALQAPLADWSRAQSLRDRLARSLAMADAMGPSDPGFDMKAYTDEMWGER